MKYKKMTAHEFTEKTVKDIEARRKRIEDGKKQAGMHCIENRDRIQRKLSHGRY
ncbi:MAG: transcriptional regulator [Clostridium butyricum]|nr:transcriptional regulator [Clostridium butyricum]